MDTGSVLDIVTSVDLGSVVNPMYELNAVIQNAFRVVTAALFAWTSGSAAVAGSLDTLLGSAGTTLGSLAGQ